MRFSDLIGMCFGSLRRRKLRTVLTVLGVVIGTASVVIMMSLGIGLTNLTTDMYASYGSMTSVTVNSPSRWGGDMDSKADPMYLTDDVVTQLAKLSHVSSVCPQLNYSVIMKQGQYECNTQLVGVTPEFFEQVDLGSGTYPSTDKNELSLLMGNTVLIQFYNTKTGMGYWENQEAPDVDYSKPLFVIFDMDAYWMSQNGDSNVKAPKKYMLNVSGVTEGDLETWSDYSYNVYCNLESLKTQLKKIYKNKPIPGQPTTKKGKPLGYFTYDTIVLYCDDMNNVTDVQKVVNDMGYQAYSNMEWIEQSLQQTNIIQLVLGGIGGISLLVAAIGIANTMMMSIYERTKEIGIIKVLGLDMRQIRNMFLIESGLIGFIGGTVGIIISIIISTLLNKIGAGGMVMGVEGNISQIPVYLALGGVVFATLVGMVAGFFPSLRAMRLSPLAAIRNE